MTSKIIYKGDLRCEAEHTRSGTVIQTDAPVDNRGKGEAFSPTDLIAVALATCILTTMAIGGSVRDIVIDGSDCEVEKIMAADPRRIDEIRVQLNMRGMVFTEKEKTVLEHIARTCPVHLSLHPDVKKTITFNWERR